jgi:hypothetical protein
LGPLGTATAKRPILPALGGYDDEQIGRMVGKGNLKYSEKTCPIAALSTTKTTCCPGCEPGTPRWEASDKPFELRHGHL